MFRTLPRLSEYTGRLCNGLPQYRTLHEAVTMQHVQRVAEHYSMNLFLVIENSLSSSS